MYNLKRKKGAQPEFVISSSYLNGLSVGDDIKIAGSNLTSNGTYVITSIKENGCATITKKYANDRMDKMKLLKKEHMEKLNTKRLLAYKNALLKVPERPDWDWIEHGSSRLNKTSPEWIETMQILKEILKTREHVERK